MNNPLSRLAVVGLPLILIALIAGGAGYLTAGSEPKQVTPLPAEEARATAITGSVQGFSNDELAIVLADGTSRTYEVPGESTIERLIPLTRSDLMIGDWINGGAILHPDTVLALVGLVLISDPVIQSP